ncbi:MAG: hypothetical protein ACREMD_16645, partial [Gemmatimonadota bacterium]
ERLIALEAARESQRQQRLAEFRARFLDGPTLRMTPGADFRFSFDPNAAVSLDEVGTVYEPVRVVDAWGILEAESALLTRSAEGQITGVVVAAPAGADGPPTEGEGWTLALEEGWEIVSDEGPGDWIVREISSP